MSQSSKIPPQLVLIDGVVWNQFMLWAHGNNLDLREEEHEWFPNDFVLRLVHHEPIDDKAPGQ